MPGAQCTVCKHPQLTEINTALVEGGTIRNVAKQYGLSPTAVYRHKSEHIKGALARAADARDLARGKDGGDLLSRVQAHVTRMERLQETVDALLEEAAEHRGKLAAISTATQVSRELRGCYELLGNMVSELRKAEASTTRSYLVEAYRQCLEDDLEKGAERPQKGS
ncbi:MAG: hypothetical protein AB1714_11225 [Acidobacteriota bacterium]